MRGRGYADVLTVYFKCPTTKQMRCPVNAYKKIKPAKYSGLFMLFYEPLSYVRPASSSLMVTATLWRTVSINAPIAQMASVMDISGKVAEYSTIL
jgi:hypothetical protein